MKKDNLLLLYSKLNDLSIKITANLKVLRDLSSDVEEEYISFCIKHNDVIDEEVFDKTLQLFDNIAYLIPYERKQEILPLLDELFCNDYVTSSEDFTDILENLITIINMPIANMIDLAKLYECGEYASEDDFIIEILKGYLNQFKSLKDLPYDKIYNQEISKINKSYFSMLEDLNNTEKNKILSDTVTEDDIAKIIAKWTNIPVAKLVSSEKEKLLLLEDNMKKRVMGQDEALELVSDAVIKSRSGIKDPNRPIASFMFLGPTGVGKTEVARTLAYELFDDERHMVRIDMSEYMEKFSVSRLIGSPPGYVGYEEGGQLTEAVRRNPYSIVLFDEVEKAHPEVLNLLLQILDDGRVTDSNGRTVDFKNTIIIMTSNLGSEHILDGNTNLVMQEVREHFRPEFINRIDEIIVFNPLSKEAIGNILDKIIKEIENRLKDINIKINVTERAKEQLINDGYDINYGARPLKRLVSRTIETMLSKKIIAGQIKPNDTVIIDYEDDNYMIKE